MPPREPPAAGVRNRISVGIRSEPCRSTSPPGWPTSMATRCTGKALLRSRTQLRRTPVFATLPPSSLTRVGSVLPPTHPVSHLSTPPPPPRNLEQVEHTRRLGPKHEAVVSRAGVLSVVGQVICPMSHLQLHPNVRFT